jgi:spore coat protein CotH
VCLFVVAALVGCGGGGGGGGGTPTGPSATSAPPSATLPPGGSPIFDPTLLHDARLEIDPSAWKALRENYLSNQYYAANFSVDGVAVAQVGIRSRGLGSRSEEKPGLKIDFNRYVPSQEYYGYKTLVIDNLTQDASMLRERLSFLVFEAMGIASPRNAHARLIVNGEYWGVFALVEPVSKPFLRRRFGEDSGNLFNYEWREPDDSEWRGYDFEWRGDNPDEYVPVPFQPETNKDKPDVATGLVAFVRAINETPSESFVAAIGSRIDVDRLLIHLATENALAERDGLVGDFSLNNFYLYEYGQKNRFVFIPWDRDNSFTSAAWLLYRNLHQNVLTLRLTDDPAKRQFYADAVVRAATNYVNPRWLTPQLETAYQQIRQAALADVRKPYSNGDFEEAVQDLRSVIAGREHDVNAQR